ncbi:uridine kinase family protein [Demequina flava]|uniref:uridine kinase family protein n=1 Tax=Demequina flava TaxID=1095025 RepID=UPI00128CFAFC|nr:AAA family ATPase [Demequina flava]
MTVSSIRDLVDLVSAARALPGGTRVVLIDGPAGSGKTTLAGRLANALGGVASAGAGQFDPVNPLPDSAPVHTLHGDDMYEGWSGLPVLDQVLVDQVLDPLSRGQRGGFRMWDWHRSERTHRIEVPPRPYLIIEGVGVGRVAARERASVLVWIEAPDDVRLERGIERDGEAMRSEWLTWMDSEREHFASDKTREAADLSLHGTVHLTEL